MCMGRISRLRVAAVATAIFWLTSCGTEDHNASDEEAVSYASRELGSHVVPTNDASFRLVAADGPMRLDVLRSFIVQSGYRGYPGRAERRSGWHRRVDGEVS